MRFYIGVDVGSVAAKIILLDEELNIHENHYIRTKGQPFETTFDILSKILESKGMEKIKGISVTGSSGKIISELIGAAFVNEIIANATSTSFYHPDVRTIIEIGGQDSKLIFLSSSGHGCGYNLEDFSMNSLCAAGTGSFLDQQASRLGLTIEEFSEFALKSKNPPRIAGRCSVFAKSDMIHLQQIATPDYDIVAGLCYAVARNFKSTIGKGKEFIKPVAFQGGVAANLGVRKAFRDVLGLKEEELIVPQYFAFMGAIGAVIAAKDELDSQRNEYSMEKLEEYIIKPKQKGKSLPRLSFSSDGKFNLYNKRKIEIPEDEKIPVYLGVDVGSISTNVVLIDEKKNVVARRYLMTSGRPIEAVKQGLMEIGEEVGDRVIVKGAGTTGSGRYLIGDLIGADIVKNEITAQATAAINIDPEVDTIFEIGGQDSKYISIRNGAVVDFEMNKVCAAGTGSFLEEQAERLGISIKGEFSDIALSCPTPASLGDRCTVFIESDLLHHQQRGATRSELVSGLAYSIVKNYLNRVVGDRHIGNKIFFQGGTASNLSVVAAFEKVLNKKIIVPEHHDVTGAIGVAIIAKEYMQKNPHLKTKFKGFDISRRNYQISTFECRDCSNLCEIRKVSLEGEKPLFYGSRCEKFDIDKKRKKDVHIPDLFTEREELLEAPCEGEDLLSHNAPIIGYPRLLLYHELFPFFKAFFTALGYRIICSEKTNKSIIRKGVELTVAEQCFPVKVAYGHIMNLIEKGIDTIFLPSIVNMKITNPGCKEAQNCPYTISLPYVARSAFDFSNVKVLTPVIHFAGERRVLEKELIQFGRELGRSASQVRMAIEMAEYHQKRFYNAMLSRGEEVLKNVDFAIVIIGRPYNSCDQGVNLSLPKIFRDLGVLPIPMDYLPIWDLDLGYFREMYWKCGQKILAAGNIIKNDERLFGVYITNFGCGPDSFIGTFFKKLLQGKPYLQIEIDEHSADAGMITRCEAFLDSLENYRERKKLVDYGDTRQMDIRRQ